MDLSPRGECEPGSDTLRSLAARVTELEREVAALRLAAAPTSAPPATGRTGTRTSHPLPPPLQQLLPAAPDAQPEPAAPKRSLEDRLGSQVFNRVGIVALLVAASWGLKLAFENQLIGPVGRVAIGLLAGAGLALWSERFRRRGFALFSYSLKAVGTGVLYLTLWAGFQVYALLPAPVALALMVAVTAWNAFMSWSQDSELLAAYALSGALATPLLLSTGGNHERFLFTYLLALDLSTLLLVRLKPWPRLLLSALAGTAAFYFGWYLRFYNFLFVSGSTTPPFGITTAFLLAFGTVFALPSVRGILRWPEPTGAASARSRPAMLSVLLPFGNAIFVALALSLLVGQQFQYDLLPWLMVAFAVVYLALARVQRTVASAAVHLALAVIFLTVAIPLKVSGHTLTVAWFAEGAALLWASSRAGSGPDPHLGPNQPGPSSTFTPANVLRMLSLAGYLLGMGALFFGHFLGDLSGRHVFFSADLFSSLVAAATLAVAALLSLRSGAVRSALLAFLGLDAVALLLASGEFLSRQGVSAQAFLNPDFARALVALALLAASALAMRRLPRPVDRAALTRLAAVTFVLFNLLALLAVETEIDALWQRSESNLQRSLAVSGFLMLYGAVLLTLGFLRRSAFTRWQALVLILFTISKVFLYDMHSLSQGYRVVSFMALGVLLMAVSFSYQRDWLSLKSPQPPGEAPR